MINLIKGQYLQQDNFLRIRHNLHDNVSSVAALVNRIKSEYMDG